jgi:hypothetical protein
MSGKKLSHFEEPGHESGSLSTRLAKAFADLGYHPALSCDEKFAQPVHPCRVAINWMESDPLIFEINKPPKKTNRKHRPLWIDKLKPSVTT